MSLKGKRKHQGAAPLGPVRPKYVQPPTDLSPQILAKAANDAAMDASLRRKGPTITKHRRDKAGTRGRTPLVPL